MLVENSFEVKSRFSTEHNCFIAAVLVRFHVTSSFDAVAINLLYLHDTSKTSQDLTRNYLNTFVQIRICK